MHGVCTRYCADMCAQPQLAEAKPHRSADVKPYSMEVHKVLRLPRILHVKKQVNTLITMEERTGDHRRQPQTTQHPQPLMEHGGSQSAAPATNSARGGSQSAAPATNSARQQTSEYSNHNGGTDRRPPPTTADNATPTASNGAWRFAKCCACHEFW